VEGLSFQIPFNTEDVQNTAISTISGLVEYKRMPFSLTLGCPPSGTGLTGLSSMARNVDFGGWSGTSPFPSHVDIIQDFLCPSTVTELQACLGMVNF
jgi:hypothetical protein